VGPFGGEELRRGFSRHGNRRNPYAWSLLLGEPGPAAFESARPAAIEVHCADAADYLERCAAGRFRGFSLSNVLDGADPAYARRLLSAVRRAAAPDAVVVLRSFASPRDVAEEERAGRDRALLWGRVSVIPAVSEPVF
jgi:S-adenosylmethionine:diacylglycerol 3-amino-3-carboxypropyl transferase